DADPPSAFDGATTHDRPPLQPGDAQEAANGADSADAAVFERTTDASLDSRMTDSRMTDSRMTDEAADSGPMRDGGAGDAGRDAEVDSGLWARGVLIKNLIQDQRVDVAGDHVSNDQELMQWPPNGSPSQLWDFARLGVTSDGYPTYQIINENSKRCMEV